MHSHFIVKANGDAVDRWFEADLMIVDANQDNQVTVMEMALPCVEEHEKVGSSDIIGGS